MTRATATEAAPEKTQVAIRSFLEWLNEGVAAITADDIAAVAPDTEPEPGEVVLGEASETVKRLYAFYIKVGRALEERVMAISFDDVMSSTERPPVLNELMRERSSFDALSEVLWAEVRSCHPESVEGIGLRSGFRIVKLPSARARTRVVEVVMLGGGSLFRL